MTWEETDGVTKERDRFSPGVSRIFLAGLLVVLTACDSGEPSATQAGTVARVMVPAPEDTVLWPVTPAPLLRIGAEGGESGSQFHDIRGAIRLADGRMVVADGSTRELRFFDTGGDFLGSAGGRGGGPGEFESVDLLGRGAPDTLLVLDASLRRISLFLSDGTFLSSSNFAADLPPLLTPLGQIGPREIVVRERPALRFPTTPGGHVARDSLAVLAVGLDGTARADFGRFPGPEMYLKAGPGANRGAPLAFGSETFFALASDRLFAWEGREAVMRSFSADGDLAGVFQMSRPSVPVRREDLDLLVEELADRYGRGRASEITPLYEEMPVPDHFPMIGRLTMDVPGRLWVQDYPRPGLERVRWTVLDTQGLVLARADLPRGLRVTEIGEDYVLGIQRDEDEVEYVVLYGLSRAVPDAN